MKIVWHYPLGGKVWGDKTSCGLEMKGKFATGMWDEVNCKECLKEKGAV